MAVPFNEVYGRMHDAARFKNASALARSLGITPQAISRHKKRDSFPTALAVKFAVQNNLSIDWLLTGKGEGPKDGQLELCTRLDLGELTPDEAVYIGKVLKLLRSKQSRDARIIIDAIDREVAA